MIGESQFLWSVPFFNHFLIHFTHLCKNCSPILSRYIRLSGRHLLPVCIPDVQRLEAVVRDASPPWKEEAPDPVVIERPDTKISFLIKPSVEVRYFFSFCFPSRLPASSPVMSILLCLSGYVYPVMSVVGCRIIGLISAVISTASFDMVLTLANFWLPSLS